MSRLNLFTLLLLPMAEVQAQFAATTTFTFTGDALPTGLMSSDYTVTSEEDLLDYRFQSENVAVRDGFLELTVPGWQTVEPLNCAEVETEFSLLYGSVRTYAILTETPGVVNGMFSYLNDGSIQEQDIEWVSDPESFSNLDSPSGGREMQYGNQAPSGDPDEQAKTYGKAPEDATSVVHEYRLDWNENSTDFYLDGVLQHSETQYVPDKPTSWLWNNWANGDPYWTADPPATDAVFKIQKIVMLYNPA